MLGTLFWIGWLLFLWAWADFAIGWLLGIDIWKSVFGLTDPNPIHFSPTIVSCFAIVFIVVGGVSRKHR